MKPNYFLKILLVTALALGPVTPLVRAEDPDNTAVVNEFKRREENLGHLSIDEQLKIRAAQQKALEDAGVKEAMQKRDQAMVEFREKLRAAMIAADPAVKAILDRIAEGTRPGLQMGK
ncbi:MAG: hypothetical protein ACR2HH_03155 [Chthoniobacterales bacterium]